MKSGGGDCNGKKKTFKVPQNHPDVNFSSKIQHNVVKVVCVCGRGGLAAKLRGLMAKLRELQPPQLKRKLRLWPGPDLRLDLESRTGLGPVLGTGLGSVPDLGPGLGRCWGWIWGWVCGRNRAWGLVWTGSGAGSGV